MTKATFLCLGSILLSTVLLGQQFSGSTSTTGSISREGTIHLDQENAGLVVDAGALQRSGLMKYDGRPTGFWTTGSNYFEMGKITSGTLLAPTGFRTDFLLTETGSIGVGIHPGNLKMAVNGAFGARSVLVTLNAWPDYVFDKKYILPSLAELEAYIAEHQHLPGIPPASEVLAKGLDVGEMNMKLMEKIEELTLYIIDLKKEVQHIKAQQLAAKKDGKP